MTEISDENIQKLIAQHVARQVYQRDYYRERYNNDPEHREVKKARAKEYYNTHKKVKHDKYELEGNYQRALKRWKYATKTNTIERFKEKYKIDYDTYFASSE